MRTARARKLLRILAGILGFVFIMVGLIDGIVPAARAESWPLRLVSTSIGVGLVVAMRPRRRSEPSLDQLDGRSTLLSDEQIRHYTGAAWKRYEPFPGPAVGRMVEEFLNLMQTNYGQTSEKVEVVGDLLKSTVTLDIRLDDMASPANVPVVVPVPRRKGQVFDEFEVCDGSGDQLPLLPPEITFGLLCYALLGLFQVSMEKPDIDFDDDERRALYEVNRLVCDDDPITEGQFEAKFDNAMRLLPTITDVSRKKLRDFCLYFAVNTIVAVETHGAVDQLSVRFTYVMTPPGRLATKHDRVRAFVGLPPFRYRIPLAWPYRSQRYDLRVVGPNAQFVYRHGLAVTSGGALSGVDLHNWLSASPSVQVRVHPDVGLPFADLTITSGYRAALTDFECVVEFEEIPPGALGRTLLISTTCSVMFVVFAFLLPHVAGRAGSPANLGAILLALPAFAATWIGHSAERLQQSSVTTIAGLAATGAISIAGSVLYMSQTALWNGWTFRDLTMLTIPVPPFDLPWFLLGLSSVVVTTVLGTRWRHRMDRYVETLRRRDPTPVPNSAPSG